MKRWIIALLMTVGVANAQEVSPMGEKPSAESVKKAKEVLALVESKAITLPLHGYALVPMKAAGTPFIVPDSDDCLAQLLIPKGGTYEGFLVSKDKPGLINSANRVIQADPAFDTILVRGLKPGKSTIVWHSFKDGKSFIVDSKSFVVLPDDPGPTPPTPPGPLPPEPLPPIPGAGFRVLFIVENKDLSSLPADQLTALTAREVLDYLNAKTVRVDGQPEWRRFQPDTETKLLSQVWKDAMARPRSSVPWIIVTDGATGYEGPLPKNTAELMTLLKKYGK